MRKIVIAVFIVSIVLSGCAKSSATVTCTYDVCKYPAPAGEITRLEDFLRAAGITNATKHCSGMYYQITNEGTGASATPCSNVSVIYRGFVSDSLKNGKPFEETTSPIFLGLPDVVAGWRNGIPLVKKGGSITLYIPPYLGFGGADQLKNGVVLIPGNSIIVFNVQVVDIQ